MNEHKNHFVVVVAVGGIAETMTAIAAASEGASTLLIERYSAVGGMATMGLAQPITMWGIRNQHAVGGRGGRLLQRLSEQSPLAATPMSHYGPTCDAEHLKRLLEVTALEAGVKLLYHSRVTGLEKKEDVLTGLQVVSKAVFHTIRGQIFVKAAG